MEFAPINNISTLQNMFSLDGANGETQENKESNLFADIFASAIDNVIETDAKQNDLQYRLATGQLDNPAELTIATTEAAVSVEMLVQLRNRAVDAYTEIMRIGI